MSKKVYCNPELYGSFAFSDINIAKWYFKKIGYKYNDFFLDDDKIIKQYYEENLTEQKEKLLNLLKEQPEEAKKIIDEVLDEMYKRK